MNPIFFYIPSLGYGGAEKVFINIANSFSENYDVFIVLHKDNSEQVRLLNEKITILNIGSKNKFLSLLKLIKLIRDIKPKAVYSTLNIPNILNIFAKIFSGVKYKVITRQASPINFKNYDIVKFLLRISFIKADIIIANSQYTKESIIKNLKIKATSKIKIIYNPIYDPYLYYLSKNTDELFTHIVQGEKYILCVGRLEKSKNFQMVLRAFQLSKFNKNIKLLILGNGSQKKELEDLAIDLKISSEVIFAGNHSNPYPFYRYATLFISSSIWEGFGNVIVEALCFGLPIIATNSYGASLEILENGKYGSLVNLDDYKQMANVIDTILTNKPIQKSTLVKRAQDFSVEKISYQYLSIIE